MRVEPNVFQVHLLNHSDTAATQYQYQYQTRRFTSTNFIKLMTSSHFIIICKCNAPKKCQRQPNLYFLSRVRTPFLIRLQLYLPFHFLDISSN